MIDAARGVARISLLVFLVSSMLAAGLSLTLRAILAPLGNRRLVLAALTLNFLVAPLFALLLTIVIPLEHPHAIGLLLLGGAAGAPFLPKLVESAHCDLGFAVALMTLLTVGTIFFMPFALPLIIPGLGASPWSIARPLVVLIFLPLASRDVAKVPKPGHFRPFAADFQQGRKHFRTRLARFACCALLP
jgi:bile acid:Na+ symporter, BASS family